MHDFFTYQFSTVSEIRILVYLSLLLRRKEIMTQDEIFITHHRKRVRRTDINCYLIVWIHLSSKLICIIRIREFDESSITRIR